MDGQTESQQLKTRSGAHAYSLCREQYFHFLAQSGSESKAPRNQNRAKSSQAMPIPGTAGEATESAFLWKRETFESSKGRFAENCSAEFVKSMVFRSQQALFEGCTFPMWRPCRPQTQKSGNRKLQIENHEFSTGRDEILVGHVLEHHDLRRMKAR